MPTKRNLPPPELGATTGHGEGRVPYPPSPEALKQDSATGSAVGGAGARGSSLKAANPAMAKELLG